MGVSSRAWGGTHLGADVTALGPQLVDLGLGDVGAFLSLLQLMLDPPAPGQLRVGLLLLKGRPRGQEAEEAPPFGSEALGP